SKRTRALIDHSARLTLSQCLCVRDRRRHLIQALRQANLGHLHHLAWRPGELGHPELGPVLAEGLELHDMALALREVGGEAERSRVDRGAVLVAEVVDVLHAPEWLDRGVLPGAVHVASAELLGRPHAHQGLAADAYVHARHGAAEAVRAPPALDE